MDRRPVGTGSAARLVQAIRGLREYGLFKVGDAEVAESAPAALRPIVLLT